MQVIYHVVLPPDTPAPTPNLQTGCIFNPLIQLSTTIDNTIMCEHSNPAFRPCQIKTMKRLDTMPASRDELQKCQTPKTSPQYLSRYLKYTLTLSLPGNGNCFNFLTEVGTIGTL